MIALILSDKNKLYLKEKTFSKKLYKKPDIFFNYIGKPSLQLVKNMLK